MISYLPLSVVAELWGIPFIEKRYGVPTKVAAISSIVQFVGFGIGGIVIAYIAEKMNNYKKTIILSTILSTFAFAIALYCDCISFAVCMALLFSGGFFAGANTLCFAVIFNLTHAQYAATSTGYMNTLIMASGLVFQPLLGKMLDFFRNGVVTNTGEPLYNVETYRSAFLIVVVCMVVAVILTFFICDDKQTKKNKLS
jgi:MFS family permease